ncbi:MAG: hypothetical protein ACYSTS_12720 [Planctomycetota bacterium]
MRKTVSLCLIGLLIVLVLAACSTVKEKVVPEKFPTIAHVHIGHAITGWEYTPDKNGLFQAAEEEANIALSNAEYALRKPNEIGLIKLHVGHVMHAVNPEFQKKGAGLGFGLKRALTESVSHIKYAAESDDASENVRNFAKPFARNVEATLERCDLILTLGEEILSTVSLLEATSLAREILNMARANVEGVDTDGNGDIGPDLSEYGLKQLRSQIDAMVSREVPPYRPVAQRYLFGLIRLPTGKWIFSFSKKRSGGRKGYGG